LHILINNLSAYYRLVNTGAPISPYRGYPYRELLRNAIQSGF
jgi:hypothetical protein